MNIILKYITSAVKGYFGWWSLSLPSSLNPHRTFDIGVRMKARKSFLLLMNY
jgi:hypothetical protein